MRMPDLPYSGGKYKKSVIEWAGLDQRAQIADNALSSTTNLSTKNSPLLNPRGPRETAYTLSNGQALFASSQLAWVDGSDAVIISPANDITFGAHTISSASSKFSNISVGDTLIITSCTVNPANNQTVIVTTATAAMITCSASTFTTTNGTPAGRETGAVTFSGCSFRYNNAAKGVVTSGAKSMVELSKRIVIFPDKKSYDTVGNTFGAFGSGNYYNPAGAEAGSVPDIQYACVLDNRIWGVDNKDNICCTALGDFDNWTTFSKPSEATDAWQVDTGTNGDFTGIVAYKGTNIVFKKDCVWKRYGDIPGDFAFKDFSRLGCVSHKSIKEVNNILFWLSPQGVVAYTGGVPEVIGEELNDSYVSAVAGGDDRRYYISLYNGTEYKLYVYDTWKNAWVQEDNMHAIDFAYFNGFVYALSVDNKILRFNAGTEKVNWAAVTKAYSENIMEKKGHSELMFRVDLATGSSLNVYVKIDGGSFELVKSYSVSDLTTFHVPLKIKKGNTFAVKLVGSGEGTIYQMQRKFIIGSDT